jgi:hypothetical protein
VVIGYRTLGMPLDKRDERPEGSITCNQYQ